ncbi:hypothetical protein AK812_SmicGene11542 [Symbiodinium microadriaticum]|uniref:Uncharacterized protein n=1 Tax=Symbiodinium microadriaticum TaxID=2951 RepID=A0A1Q9ED02_SYMMI|nr:hypothetical protein AK812_SmicGene11542 [Symbiodinium microadriaticum]
MPKLRKGYLPAVVVTVLFANRRVRSPNEGLAGEPAPKPPPDITGLRHRSKQTLEPGTWFLAGNVVFWMSTWPSAEERRQHPEMQAWLSLGVTASCFKSMSIGLNEARLDSSLPRVTTAVTVDVEGYVLGYPQLYL